MADIQAFMTGFLGARAQKMQVDQAKADDAEDRLRNIALRNQQIAMNRDALSNAAKGMGDQLLSWGATPDQIQAALKSGQTGLASLYKTVKGVKDTLGEDETKRFLGTVNADIGAAAAVGQEGLGDLYRQTFGLPMGTKVGDYKAPQESTLAKLFGATDRKAKMLENLDSELSGVGGYSVYDLTTIGTLPDYLPGSAGESISYKQPTIYSSANFADEADFVDTRLKDLAQNPEYKFAQEEYNAAAKDMASTQAAVGSDPYNKVKERLDAAESKIKTMQDAAIKQSVLTQASQYFNDEDYLQAIKGHISTAYGFVPSWFTEEEEAAKVATEITNQSLSGGLTGTDPLSDTQPKATTPKVVQTVTTDNGEKIEVAEVDGQKVVLNANGQPLPAEASAEILAEIEAMPAFMEKAASRKFGREGDISTYKTMYEGLMSLPEEQRSSYVNAFQSLEEIPSVVEVVEDVAEAAPEFTDKVVGKAVGGAGMGANAVSVGFAKAYAFLTGDVSTAAKQIANAEQRMQTAQEIAADGIVQYLQDVADESGMTGGFGAARGERIKKAILQDKSIINAVNDMVENLPSIDIKSVSPEEADAALQRAPEHVEKLGDQAMDAWRKLTAEVQDFKMSDLKTPDEENPMVKLVTGFIGEDNLKAYQEGRLAGKEKEAMEERIRDDARQFLQDEKSFPQPLPKIVIDTIVEEAPEVVFSRNRRTQGKTTDLGDMTGAPGFREDPSLADIIADQRTLAVDPTYVSYEEWDSMSKAERKAIKLDVSKVRIENMVRGGRIPLPRGVELPDRLVEMRMSSMPTPAGSGELPDLPRNMAVESMLTRRERGPSLMRRPSDPEQGDMPSPEELDKSTALVDLRSVMARVHGKKSKAVKELDKIVQQSNRGIPIQYTDVNRLLRMTKSLRKSETRDTLIEQLAILANEARK